MLLISIYLVICLNSAIFTSAYMWSRGCFFRPELEQIFSLVDTEFVATVTMVYAV